MIMMILLQKFRHMQLRMTNGEIWKYVLLSDSDRQRRVKLKA